MTEHSFFAYRPSLRYSSKVKLSSVFSQAFLYALTPFFLLMTFSGKTLAQNERPLNHCDSIERAYSTDPGLGSAKGVGACLDPYNDKVYSSFCDYYVNSGNARSVIDCDTQ